MTAVSFAAMWLAAILVSKTTIQAFKKLHLLAVANRPIIAADLIFIDYYSFNTHYFTYAGFAAMGAINAIDCYQMILHAEQTILLFSF